MRRFFALALATLALGACGQPDQIYVSDGWTRLPAVQGNPAAAYFTLHGGAEDATLISVTSPVAIKSEMHETMAKGNMTTMAPVKQIALPADGEIIFAPGGKHVMLFDVNPVIEPGKKVPLLFTFSSGLRIQFDTNAIAAGAPAPKID